MEAEARIDAVRSKFERQLLRLRERERLVAVSREDSRQEDDTLERDRARHQADKEKVLRQGKGIAALIVAPRVCSSLQARELSSR